jgi:hypothetical protein
MPSTWTSVEGSCAPAQQHAVRRTVCAGVSLYSRYICCLLLLLQVPEQLADALLRLAQSVTRSWWCWQEGGLQSPHIHPTRSMSACACACAHCHPVIPSKHSKTGTRRDFTCACACSCAHACSCPMCAGAVPGHGQHLLHQAAHPAALRPQGLHKGQDGGPSSSKGRPSQQQLGLGLGLGLGRVEGLRFDPKGCTKDGRWAQQQQR